MLFLKVVPRQLLTTTSNQSFKPIFRCDAKPFALGTFAQNPQRESVEYRLRCSSGVGHVYFMSIFMYISCCLCIILRVGYARIGRRKGSFQWNMGFTFYNALLSFSKFLTPPPPTHTHPCTSSRCTDRRTRCRQTAPIGADNTNLIGPTRRARRFAARPDASCRAAPVAARRAAPPARLCPR